uniref:DRBM domain-containing protein n=1 Tax=Cacopsylla melanoneura TaxID=428564 RepID=A0A8D8YRE8_9HEMI
MANKTPRIILLEYLARVDEKPIYTELPQMFPDPLSTKSVFHYEVSAYDGQYNVKATGQTRKEAKHEAAKKMLSQLATDKMDVRKLLEENNFDIMVQKSFAVDPEKNVLNKLNAICLMNNIGAKFILIKEAGEAHNKLYTMRCEVENLKVPPIEATKRSMKGAKIACAKKLLELIEDRKQLKLLVDIPKDFKPSYSQEEIQKELSIVQSILEARTLNPIKATNVKLSKFHLTETDPDCDVIFILNQVKKELGLNHDMFVRYLNTASMPDIGPIIARLNEDKKKIKIDVLCEQLPATNLLQQSPKFIVFVRFFSQGITKSFCSIGVNKFECEKKGKVNLLKFLSALELNTTGRSALLDNPSSEEDWQWRDCSVVLPQLR